MHPPKRILPVIVISQFCCTSLWFAGNAVLNDLIVAFQLSDDALGHLTSSVQFGFIIGTLVFALMSIADRHSPSLVFMVCAIAGALLNTGVLIPSNGLVSLIAFRFLTGFFLAGIYPVGMKIASDYYDKGLGKSLGFLVGALVLGTAFPHFLKGITSTLPWKSVIMITSALAVFGGLLMFVNVPNGPFRKAGQRVDLSAIVQVFKPKGFRSAAFGYFGHMWELYTFWAFVPIMLSTYSKVNQLIDLDVSFWSFIIIGSGSLSCVIGGYIAQRWGEKRTASTALFLSGLCCLISPLAFHFFSQSGFLIFLLFWGLVVIADSPLFSTLVAKNASAETRGTALTIVNCIGFSLTILSIQLISSLRNNVDLQYLYLLLVIGPLFGLIALKSRR